MKPTGEHRACKICGTSFYVKRSHIKLGKGKYCSYKCMGISNIGKIPWNKNKTYKSSKPSMKKAYSCTNCNKEYLAYPHEEKIYCSESCRSIFVFKRDGSPRKGIPSGFEARKKISAYNQGIKLSEWKGFITSKEKIERAKFRNEIQKQVFKRDNYTCQLCGDKNGNGKTVSLQVDHIQSWAEYVELRFCIDNCRTLCMACHYQITFGKPMPPTVKAWGHNMKTLRGGNNL